MRVINYELKVRVLIEEKQLVGECSLKAEVDERELLALNKGLEVVKVGGEIVSWSQKQELFNDAPIKANFVELQLEKGVREFSIEYRGGISGYQEVFSYMKDRISEEYSLIRTDAFSYPVPASKNLLELIKELTRQKFTYKLVVQVPSGYTVANIGGLEEVREGEFQTYIYTSKLPSWRIDIAISKFEVVEKGDVKAFCFKEHVKHGERLIRELNRAFKFFVEWFGEPRRWVGYTIIEVPEGWGAQADVCGMLLDERAFEDYNRVSSLYHELAHLWNVESCEKAPSRFLDEGFASYFQALAERKLVGEEKFRETLKQAVEKFKRQVEKQQLLMEIPLSKYGEYMLTDASYTCLLYTSPSPRDRG